MADSQSLRIVEEGQTLRIEWDNRGVPKDHFVLAFLILFWTLWCPLTLFVTWLAITRREPFFFIWLLFGWLGTVGIPYMLLGRRWTERIEFSKEGVTHDCRGLLAPKTKVYPLRPKMELLLGFYDEESSLTLNLLWSTHGYAKRRIVAYWLSPKLKHEVFDAVARFARATDLELTMTRT